MRKPPRSKGLSTHAVVMATILLFGMIVAPAAMVAGSPNHDGSSAFLSSIQGHLADLNERLTSIQHQLQDNNNAPGNYNPPVDQGMMNTGSGTGYNTGSNQQSSQQNAQQSSAVSSSKTVGDSGTNQQSQESGQSSGTTQTRGYIDYGTTGTHSSQYTAPRHHHHNHGSKKKYSKKKPTNSGNENEQAQEETTPGHANAGLNQQANQNKEQHSTVGSYTPDAANEGEQAQTCFPSKKKTVCVPTESGKTYNWKCSGYGTDRVCKYVPQGEQASMEFAGGASSANATQHANNNVEQNADIRAHVPSFPANEGEQSASGQMQWQCTGYGMNMMCHWVPVENQQAAESVQTGNASAFGNQVGNANENQNVLSLAYGFDAFTNALQNALNNIQQNLRVHGIGSNAHSNGNQEANSNVGQTGMVTAHGGDGMTINGTSPEGTSATLGQSAQKNTGQNLNVNASGANTDANGDQVANNNVEQDALVNATGDGADASATQKANDNQQQNANVEAINLGTGTAANTTNSASASANQEQNDNIQQNSEVNAYSPQVAVPQEQQQAAEENAHCYTKSKKKVPCPGEGEQSQQPSIRCFNYTEEKKFPVSSKNGVIYVKKPVQKQTCQPLNESEQAAADLSTSGSATATSHQEANKNQQQNANVVATTPAQEQQQASEENQMPSKKNGYYGKKGGYGSTGNEGEQSQSTTVDPASDASTNQTQNGNIEQNDQVNSIGPDANASNDQVANANQEQGTNVSASNGGNASTTQEENANIQQNSATTADSGGDSATANSGSTDASTTQEANSNQQQASSVDSSGNGSDTSVDQESNVNIQQNANVNAG